MSEKATVERKDLLAILAEPYSDEEVAHARAEEMLTAYLRGIGDAELADAWETARKIQGWWYA